MGNWSWQILGLVWLIGMVMGVGFMYAIGGQTVQRPEEDTPDGSEPVREVIRLFDKN
jgi:hypothetical protein